MGLSFTALVLWERASESGRVRRLASIGRAKASPYADRREGKLERLLKILQTEEISTADEIFGRA